MSQFGRIERLVGSALDQLNEAAILKLVAGRVREDDDLDFKLELYGRGDSDKRSLAGDVAAMANSRGGVIVLGIEEQEAAASRLPAWSCRTPRSCGCSRRWCRTPPRT